MEEGISRGALANEHSLEDQGLPSARPPSWLVSPSMTTIQIKESLVRHGPNDHASPLDSRGLKGFCTSESSPEVHSYLPAARIRAAGPKSQQRNVRASPGLALQERRVVAWLDALK